MLKSMAIDPGMGQVRSAIKSLDALGLPVFLCLSVSLFYYFIFFYFINYSAVFFSSGLTKKLLILLIALPAFSSAMILLICYFNVT
jgi:hypothetical protein